MNKVIQHYMPWKNHLRILSFLIVVLFSTQVRAQAISVQGKVLASRFPVKNASVTFIDMSDTTMRYTGLTNNLGNYQVSMTTSIMPKSGGRPDKSDVVQNYPNPFSSSTAITYRLTTRSNVRLTIYDVLGRQVRKFEIGDQNPGIQNVLWDGRNSFGQRVARGMYFYALKTGSESRVGKMLLLSGDEGSVSLSTSLPAQTVKQPDVSSAMLQGGTFAIRIENTENTSPIIVPFQMDNVAVQTDTTINFSVNYISSALVDVDSVHQYIRGFGGINIPGWQGYDMTDSEIQTAFGTGEGQLGFSILRLQIQPEKSQWSVNLPSAKKAQALGAIVFASPWDPPSNMLDPASTQHKLRYDMYGDYAVHLDSFNTYMNNNGAPLYAISVQNEPDYGDWTRWTADEILTFMRNNAPAVHNRIIAPESFQFRRPMSDPILNDSLACAHLAIVGGHVYGAGYGVYPLAEQKGKEIWMTEHYTESQNSGNLWPLALDVASDIHNVMISDWNAYVWWYIVRFYGPINDGRNNMGVRGTVTKRGYIMSQYSRFIRPGYYRVECASSPSSSNLLVSAFKDSTSSKLVVVAVNKASTPVELVVRLNNTSMNTFTPLTTSEFKNVEPGNDVNATNNQFTFTLDASSITTFVSK